MSVGAIKIPITVRSDCDANAVIGTNAAVGGAMEGTGR